MRYKIWFFLCFMVHLGYSQAKLRQLPHNVNRPSINVYAPYISGDDKSLLFLSDFTDDGELSMFYTYKVRAGQWKDPVAIHKSINRPKLNYTGGYALSFDGDMLFFTSKRTGGIAGYDIWYSEKSGNGGWSAPKNLGRPINSLKHEGNPSLSPDGRYLYFMRCDAMSQNRASQCIIMRSEKVKGIWQAPEALPEVINTGDTQTPRILADGESLIFSTSDRGRTGRTRPVHFPLPKRTPGKCQNPCHLPTLNVMTNM